MRSIRETGGPLFFLLMAIYWVSTFGYFSPSVLAAHGCATREPDRDGDGVSDKDDPFPDDPLRGGLAEKYCGSEPLTMKLFFIPFSQTGTGPVTKGAIEDKKANAIWFCSKNSVGPAILDILNQSLAESEASGTSVTLSPNDIRLKLVQISITGDETPFFVDNLGNGVRGEQSFQLTEEQRATIEEKIRKTVSDCGPEAHAHCESSKSVG